MTLTNVMQLKAATRHATATVNLWHAQRLELAAHAEWASVIEREGSGAPGVEQARAAFDTCRERRKAYARDLDEAAEALSESMRAVHEEARR
ncbi:hypothetical protein MYSTI_04150 [Myxococcus stipitatus DSM 14675]|uniref:Uncharacterized protein n=1 Tax=Myxococcus stipitatus (strain DSM 14675 / JCM 12634 / Mx s8) TaxID=1278073 RepID=L7UC66_MYXSD|nr:hypothetical protein [Myxococcus stipitatus]AGC45450.1 hypothetical protein MYSTI_04150 [Myxococcus stipitatus DSM 14675]